MNAVAQGEEQRTKHYEPRTTEAGLRTKAPYLTMIVSSGFAFGSYATYPVHRMLAIQWFFYSLVEYLIAGVVIAQVFKQVKGSAPKA